MDRIWGENYKKQKKRNECIILLFKLHGDFYKTKKLF